MDLVLHRRFLGKDYTIGRLYFSDFHLSPNPSSQGRGTASDMIVNEGYSTTENGAEEIITANVVEANTTTTISPPLWGGVGGRGELEYFCDTLEDVDRCLTQSMPLDEIRKIKIPHETAIPTGVYKVVVNLSPAKKRMLPRLLNVPVFSGILIHRGNTKRDSSGCILVGENKVKGKVINSAQYEKRLVEILTEVQKRGEEITIKIMKV
jgi:hypothetical protein